MSATKIRVHRNGVPAEVQVPVHPGGVAVEYLDDDGNVVASVIHDAASIEEIAEAKGLEVEEIDHGRPVPDPIAVAVQTNKTDRGEAEESEAEESEAEESEAEEAFDPSEHNVDDVVAYLRSVEGDEDEFARVIAAEKAGEARKGVLAEQE